RPPGSRRGNKAMVLLFETGASAVTSSAERARLALVSPISYARSKCLWARAVAAHLPGSLLQHLQKGCTKRKLSPATVLELGRTYKPRWFELNPPKFDEG